MKSLVLAIFSLISISAYACKCSELNIEERLFDSDKAYLGKLVNAKVLGDGSRIAATLQVVELFKGNVFVHEEVITNNSSCGVRFTINDSYLVFEDASGQVNQCTMYNTSFTFSNSMQKNLEKLRKLNKQ